MNLKIVITFLLIIVSFVAFAKNNTTINRPVTTIKKEIINHKSLSEKQPAIWEYLNNHQSESKQFIQYFNKDIFLDNLGLNKISSFEWWLCLGLIIVAIIISWVIRLLLKTYLAKIDISKSRYAIASVIRAYIHPFFILLFLNLYFLLLFWPKMWQNSLFLFVFAGFCLTIYLFSTHLLFNKKQVAVKILNLKYANAKLLYFRMIILGWIVFFCFIVYVLLYKQPYPKNIIILAETILITIISINVIWIASTLTRLKVFIKYFPILRYIINIILMVYLLCILITDWLGYHDLALYLLINSILTILLTIGLWSAVKIINKILDGFDFPHTAFGKQIHAYFARSSRKKLPEVFVIKIGVVLLSIVAYIYWVLQIWQVTPYYINKVYNFLFTGFAFGKMQISIIRIIIAFFIFAAVMLIGRLIAGNVKSHYQFEGEVNTQIAMVSIIIYVSFTIALLIALLFAGVNFTGLAIIAGALSVGIGLGLQSIVNNFISGLILLLEKPIKPGDRVIVGDTEGFVKRIRIRSTQISTLAREDVIVPNAELITNQVTNYMFRDRLWRVTVQVGVAYGSDIEKVKKVLLQITDEHPDVIKEEPNAPLILFREHGESTLIFETWCIIQDVNKKYRVASDLNFAINKAFRANNITIAFPQRDIHIKDK